MKKTHKTSKVVTKKSSIYQRYGSIGTLLVIGVVVAFIVGSSFAVQAASNKKAKQEVVKTYNKRDNASTAKHFLRHNKKVEDPKFQLGHCDPKEAPREMDMNSGSDNNVAWSPC